MRRGSSAKAGWLGACAAALAGCALLACGGAETEAFAAPRRVFLVTIDTLRADHLSFYGYPRETAPFLAGLAAHSAVFERAFAACSATSPAHASLLTGLYPPHHKVQRNLHARLPASVRTLAEVFREHGYATAAFVSVRWLDSLSRGFDVFEIPSRERVPGWRFAYAPAERTAGAALAWLEERGADERFLLWLHLFDPHQPYLPPAAFAKRMEPQPRERAVLLRHWLEVQAKDPGADPAGGDLEAFVRWQNQYDAEIAYADSQIARLYATSRAKDLLADSLWVITADHGEGLGGHSEGGHAAQVYQEQLHIPLLVHRPDGGLAAGRFPDLVRQVDVFPTLVEAIGAPLPAGASEIRGASLLPLLRGEAERPEARTAFSVNERKPEHAVLYALQDGRHKFVLEVDGKDRLYALTEDPREGVNLAGGGSALEDAWRERTRALVRSLDEEALEIPEPDVSERDLEQLRALGYLDGSAPGP